jgi:hypothetical protein
LIRPPATTQADLEHNPAASATKEVLDDFEDHPRLSAWLDRSKKASQKIMDKFRKGKTNANKSKGE